MTSQAEFSAYVEAQRGVRALALRDLAAWWATLTDLEPDRVRDAAREFMPILANTYGEVSASAAADFYETARTASTARGAFEATMPDSDAALMAARSVRWATDPLYTGDPDAALSRMGAAVDEAALQQGRNTIMLNAKRDRATPRFARVPVGKSCAWCYMLASRGPVYRSAETAGAARKYHAKCDCQPVPSWDQGKDLPEGYDFEAMYETYLRARGGEGENWFDTSEITARLRRLDGGSLVSDGVGPPRPHGVVGGDIPGSLRGANPGWKSGDVAYRYNCPSAVTAYEMRLRGEKVAARGASRADVARGGQDVDGFLSRWRKPDGSALEWGDLTQTRGLRGTEDLVKSWNDGQRGFIIVQWKRDGGHIFAVHNDDGKVRYLDPQSGEEWDASVFQRVAARKAFVVRSDDLDISDQARELIE